WRDVRRCSRRRHKRAWLDRGYDRGKAWWSPSCPLSDRPHVQRPPPDFRGVLGPDSALEHRSGCPAFGFSNRCPERGGEAIFFLRGKEGREWQPAPARHQKQARGAKFLVDLPIELDPQWIERPLGNLAAMADLPQLQFRRGHRDFFVC